MSAADRAKWNDRYHQQGAAADPASPWLLAHAALLPERGRAIDIAGGAGRNALWLAERGLAVTLVDISPVGLALASAEAERRGVQLDVLEIDLETEPFPAGPWDLALLAKYLCRPLFPAIIASLAPQGLLVVAQPTKKNLMRHARPPEQFLLEPGELPSLVGGMEIASYVEDWTAEGRHEAQLVARKAAR